RASRTPRFHRSCCARSPDRPVRHSFPTRRSSDLAVRKEGVPFTFAGRAREVNLEVIPFRSGPARERYFIVLFTTAPEPEPVPKGDRKSTRLNSSHRTTSYAVFCLKKKKDDAASPA